MHLGYTAINLGRDRAHGIDRTAGILLDPLDHILDLHRRPGRTLGQTANLVGDHRKAAALLAGARSLDGGIERQQVGLAAIFLITFDRPDLPGPADELLDSLRGATTVWAMRVISSAASAVFSSPFSARAAAAEGMVAVSRALSEM